MLVELLEVIGPEDYLYSAAVFALGDMGAPDVEPLLAAWPDAGEDFASAIADALVQTGAKDDRILDILLGTLPSRCGSGRGMSVRGACDHLNGWAAEPARRGTSDRHSP